MDLKEKLYASTKENIGDKGIRNFTLYILNHAPERFWTDPCSSSGRNHPPEDQNDVTEGGIVRHILKGTAICPQLCRFFNVSEQDYDITLSAWTLHDIKKNGDPWTDRTNYQHGLIAYRWLEQFPLEKEKKDKIRNGVRYHMGQWVQPEEEKPLATSPTTNELIVQLTDYFCSRKDASFLPGIGLNEEQIEKFSSKPYSLKE